MDKNYSFKSIENEIENYWDINCIYKKTRELNKENKPFFFVDGPPYTTGNIHLGTAWNKIIKDSILRYYSMNGYSIIDRPGWDMHGLPIEVKVEENLGFKTKKDIEKFGISNFISECKYFALKNKDMMTNQLKSLGIWMNWENPYMTLKDEYIETSWWITKKIYENNYLINGKRVVNWCPRCETAIADSEVEYYNKKDNSIYVKFKIKNEDDTYIIIWTTTPWTLLSNVAIAIHPNYEYVKIMVRKDNHIEYIYTLKDKIKFILKIGNYSKDYSIINTYHGKDLEGKEYIYPLNIQDEIKDYQFQRKIILAEYVTNENTGCVHISPGHGIDDFYASQKYKLPVFCIVGSDGTFNIKNIKEYYKNNINELNEKVIFQLKNMNLLLYSSIIEHRYGHCWRCKTPIIYRATEQWFIEIKKLKEKLLENIKKIKWYPDWAGSSRFKDWINDARDWCISRQRYWGIPIPLWKCDTCNNIIVIGSKKELVEISKCNSDIKLHRPYVDEITFHCSNCGGIMKRIEDIFDVWFDSAMASFSTVNFPHDNYMFNNYWPSDLIIEGHDQTRGWFYSQLVSSIAFVNKAPYKSVLMHGFTLDSYGKKMSKSIGNVIKPIDIIKEYGIDVLRLYILSSNSIWDDLKYSNEEIKNVSRFINIFWNVYKFPLPYMDLDNFNPDLYNIKELYNGMKYEDKWILSRLQSLIISINNEIKGYYLNKVIRNIFNFILEDLSRWYIQLIRERTWSEKESIDKTNVYVCLYNIYFILIKLLSPFAPYITEKIYLSSFKNTINLDSIHMTKWPKEKVEFIDRKLEIQMNIIRKIVEIVSNARQKLGRKLRWPISKIIIISNKQDVLDSISKLEYILLNQINSKKIIISNNEYWSESNLIIKPIKNILGPLFKENSNFVYNYLLSLNGNELMKKLKESNIVNMRINSDLSINISPNMISFEEQTPTDTILITTEFGKIYVDCRLNDKIIEEGYTKEIIRRVQDMRKELELNLEELVNINIYSNNKKILESIKNQEDLIKREVRSKNCTYQQILSKYNNVLLKKNWKIESELFDILIYK